MAYPVFRCDDDFPKRIPELLKGVGAKIEAISDETEKFSCPNGFAYRLTRGLAAVQIFGGTEEGEMNFCIVWGRNLNPFTWWASNRLSHEVQKELSKAGAKMVYGKQTTQIQ